MLAFDTTVNTVSLHVQADQCFELVLREGATSVTVITSSVTERDDWLTALRRLLERRIGEQRRAYPSATAIIIDHYRRGVSGDGNLGEGGGVKKPVAPMLRSMPPTHWTRLCTGITCSWILPLLRAHCHRHIVLYKHRVKYIVKLYL